MTAQHAGPPLGERMVVNGRVLDEDSRRVRGAMVEVWQANAAGRYLHKWDQQDAPLDPNFSGCGRYDRRPREGTSFVPSSPALLRGAITTTLGVLHIIHFSLFGANILSRLVTQIYFPGDPLHAFDPIFNSIEDEKAQQRIISRFDLQRTEPAYALAYSFDIVLRGAQANLFEGMHG